MAPLTSDELRSFYDTHYGRVLGAVGLVTGSRAAAEDAVHEALARAWERGGGIERLDSWVLTVALNLARNRWRSLRREAPGDPERAAAEADAARARAGGPASGDGTDGTVGTDGAGGQRVDLDRALRALPTRQREVVVLHYLLDLPVAEVADLLGLSAGGVKHALFRARRSLADALAVEEVP